MPTKNRIQQLPIPSREGYDAIFDGTLLEDVPAEIRSWNCHRVLLVVSKTLDKDTDVVKGLEKALGDIVVDKKQGVGKHSPYADVIDIASRIHRSNADCVVSVGSSSYSDACKIACTLHATLPPGFGAQDMEDLLDQDKGAVDLENSVMKPPKTKLIVVPTSLSASEWNPISSCTNSQGKKQHFGNWNWGQPDLILLDPKVASTAPEILWLSSGVRAIDHCVEITCNPRSWEDDVKEVHEHTEKGLRLLLKGLREYKAGKGKGDETELLDGISECQYGAREAIMGFLIWRVPMGASHAIGHQVSLRFCSGQDNG